MAPKKRNKTESFELRMTPQQSARLKRVALRLGISRAATMLVALDEYIARRFPDLDGSAQKKD